MKKERPLKKYRSKTFKAVCLECQCYTMNCKPKCSGTQRFTVSNSFRPPKVGSKNWKLISKLVVKQAGIAVQQKDEPTDIVCSPSFYRHSFRKKHNKGREGLPQKVKDKAYLLGRLATG